MRKRMGMARKAGFTLIEVLVTVVVIGVLAATVIPAVTSQVTAGDSTRIINDLNDVRTAIENFDIAVKQFPGDVDDLINKPAVSNGSSTGVDLDHDISGNSYITLNGWAGPYIEATLSTAATSSTVASPLTSAFNTGYTATVNNEFVGCQVGAVAACTTTSADYIAVLVNGLTGTQASNIKVLIDGAGTGNASTTGKFRYVSDATSSTGYYFATPFK